jgi:poly(3-hydroxybutyrate) depolymerase
MNSKIRNYAGTAGLLGGGLVAGAILAGSLTANAATPTPTPTAASSTATTADPAPPTNPNPGDPSKPQRSDETLLTGDTAAKVKAAALAKYPGATIVRIETDSDGVYEAHIESGGTPMIVQVGSDFTVTGTQTGGGGHR